MPPFCGGLFGEEIDASEPADFTVDNEYVDDKEQECQERECRELLSAGGVAHGVELRLLELVELRAQVAQRRVRRTVYVYAVASRGDFIGKLFVEFGYDGSTFGCREAWQKCAAGGTEANHVYLNAVSRASRAASTAAPSWSSASVIRIIALCMSSAGENPFIAIFIAPAMSVP